MKSAIGLVTLAAAAAPGVAQAAGPGRYDGGKVVAPDRLAGDGFSGAATDQTTGVRPPKNANGKRVTPGQVRGDGFAFADATGSQGLVDNAGLKWFVNTDITFNTTSSASGAMSEASFTHAVAATTLNGGTTSSTLNDAFDGYNTMAVHVGDNAPDGNPATGDPNFVIYNKNGPATKECNDRQVVLPPQVVGDLTMSRKVFVPDDSHYARWLNEFTNTGAAPLKVRMYVANNLGSDNRTTVTASSSGDVLADPGDTWVASFQNFSGSTTSDPRLGHILRGVGARVGLTELHFVDGDDNPYWSYVMTIDPGTTQVIANYAVGEATRALAASHAAVLAAAPSVPCMSTAEQKDLVNFDIVAPTLQLPSPAPSAEATGAQGAVVTYAATATDPHNADPTPTCVPASGATFPVGTTTVQCSATDPAGNTTTGSFDVTVGDTVGATFSGVPSGVTAAASDTGGALVSYTPPTATDAVDGVVPVTCTPASGSRFPIGTTTVTCAATDAHGNRSTTTFPVTVTAAKAPLFAGLSPGVSVSASIASGALASYTPPTATDFAGAPLPVACSPRSGSHFPVGTTTVTCVAVDSRGNRATATFPIIVGPPVAARSTIKAFRTSGGSLLVSGTATPEARKVRVLIAQHVGTDGCRFVQQDGSLGAKQACTKLHYITATGLQSWSVKIPRPPAGLYLVSSRAISSTGTVETKAKSRNYRREVIAPER